MKRMKHIGAGCIGLILFSIAGLVMAENPRAQDLSRAVLKIESLSCGGCFSTIDSGLSSLEGYKGMGANLFRKRIAVDFTAPLTAEKISQRISEAGYPAKLETVAAISQKESFAYIDSKRWGGKAGGGCCSGSGSADKSRAGQGSPGPNLLTGGACCPLPNIAQNTDKL